MSELFGVVPAATLRPDGVAPLAGHADQEGVRIVATELERWEDESERYRGRGEAIPAAVVGDEVVGIGA
ncbi:MAG: hypothetical protein M3445_04725 [Actinomycetota bacterium]|nr:hypothetical protein [Actinomycetota bacterium]